MSQSTQKVFLLVFTQYTASKVNNERAVETLETGGDHEPVFHGPGAEDVFPAWASESHTVVLGEDQTVRTNNLQELNDLLAEGWLIERTVPMSEGCSCLVILKRNEKVQTRTGKPGNGSSFTTKITPMCA